MKTLIITIVVLLLNLNGLISKDIKNIDNVKTIEEFREVRFSNIPQPKTYPLDTDRYIWGEKTVELNQEDNRIKNIRKKIDNKNKPQPTKIKYLDFSIITDENIS
jgi:hypothetical protein